MAAFWVRPVSPFPSLSDRAGTVVALGAGRNIVAGWVGPGLWRTDELLREWDRHPPGVLRAWTATRTLLSEGDDFVQGGRPSGAPRDGPRDPPEQPRRPDRLVRATSAQRPAGPPARVHRRCALHLDPVRVRRPSPIRDSDAHACAPGRGRRSNRLGTRRRARSAPPAERRRAHGKT